LLFSIVFLAIIPVFADCSKGQLHGRNSSTQNPPQRGELLKKARLRGARE
jgi:hypothetical protein